MAVTCPADQVFFGGSRGGGKSDCLIGRQIKGIEKYGSHWNGLVVRRKYKDFVEMRRRIDELIGEGLPAERIGGENQTNYIRFDNGAQFILAAIQRLELANDFVGHQYTEIGLDEITTFPFIIQLIDKLSGSLRSPHGVPCHMFMTGNPGGPGHNAVKQTFVSPATPGTVFYNDEGESRIFIPSFLRDNKILYENDPKYVRRLMSIKDPALRKAWLEGDWDVFIGQAFEFSQQYHVIDPIWPIPEYVPIYMTYDWGYGKPFSIGWWWVDSDDRVYRFAEWYGWDGETPDVGLRLTDSKVAEGIIEREKKFGIEGRKITRLSGPDCFSKKPNYMGGGQGPSTAEVFDEFGQTHQYDLKLYPGDPDRKLKIRQFRERLIVPDDKTLPKLVVYSTCKHFIRTVPALCVDEDNPEDIDTDQEDHVFDESCHMVMSRPMGLSTDIIADLRSSEAKKQVRAALDSTAQAAWAELDKLQKRILEMQEREDEDYDF